jgi:outer membrane biosynthesis protein TonB
MSLDVLRAWIGEVERKLGKRTRVFLALSAIAIGIAGASVYLAIDARNDSVSESDVQALQERLEAQIDALSATAATPPTAEPEPEPAEPETQPEAESKPKPKSSAKLRERLEETREKAEELE